MNLSVRPNHFNDFYVGFYGINIPPPLLDSSFTGF